MSCGALIKSSCYQPSLGSNFSLLRARALLSFSPRPGSFLLKSKQSPFQVQCRGTETTEPPIIAGGRTTTTPENFPAYSTPRLPVEFPVSAPPKVDEEFPVYSKPQLPVPVPGPPQIAQEFPVASTPRLPEEFPVLRPGSSASYFMVRLGCLIYKSWGFTVKLNGLQKRRNLSSYFLCKYFSVNYREMFICNCENFSLI